MINRPIRVVQVFASLDRGGAETMIMNLYRKIDRNKIQFDFVVNESTADYAYEKEIISLGGRIFRVPRFTFLNYFRYKQIWIDLLENHPEWNIIHGHHTSPAFAYLSVARRNKLITIAHSHIAGTEKNLKSYMKRLMRFPLRYISDYLFACSDKAANWMFGENAKNVHVINNSIDSVLFSFNNDTRNNIRQRLGIERKFVIGHIGRFQMQKNHSFLVEIFNEIKKVNEEAILLLIGDGELKDPILKQVEQLKLGESVVFLGVREDVPELLSAMDVFLFPSLYEGLPVTLIEAQANGLKTIASDTITKEVKVTKLIEFLSLKKKPKYWAERVNQYSSGYNRETSMDYIINSGYDVEENAKLITELYINMTDGRR